MNYQYIVYNLLSKQSYSTHYYKYMGDFRWYLDTTRDYYYHILGWRVIIKQKRLSDGRLIAVIMRGYREC